MEGKLQVTLNLKRNDGNPFVYYKMDGGRFKIDNTIKMKVQNPYKFTVTLRPPHKIKVALLKGEELHMSGEKSTSDWTKYSYDWSSHNINVTKKNRRLAFNLILEIENLGVLELPLQLKFYPADDANHSAWGKSLHHIDYDCICKPGSSFIEVLSQVYR